MHLIDNEIKIDLLNNEPIAEIAAITGHSLKTVDTILERYLVRTGTLAASAFQKRLAAEQQG
jgi:hypothetical protein